MGCKFSLDNPDTPKRTAQLRMPAAGEQLYLIGEEHVVLLANRSNSYRVGGLSAGSEIVLVRHKSDKLKIDERYPLKVFLWKAEWLVPDSTQ